jgi:hypothetical protein
MSRRRFNPIFAAPSLALAVAFAAASASAQSGTDPSDRSRRTGAPAAEAPSGAKPRPPSYSEKYAVLDEKNIFQKTRVRREPPSGRTARPGERTTSDSPRQRVEESLVLTGIALQGSRHVAFVEDTSACTTTRLMPGDPIANGRIAAVERDHVEYEADGGRTRVDIGHNFSGGLSPVASGATSSDVTGASPADSGTASTRPTTGPATAASAGGAPPDPKNPNLSIEERMRLRRAQEQRK